MEYSNKLYKKGVFYRRLGYSVIPVHGNRLPERFKAAAIRWSEFQKRQPATSEIENWFYNRQFGGLAIVCGEVSQLAVLDFDDPAAAELFATLHPELTQTYTVASGKRGLPHYYFHIPTGVRTRSRSIRGVDWQYNGRYVIAPPTISPNSSWHVTCDVLARTLSASDVDTIMSFLDRYAASGVEETPQPVDLSLAVSPPAHINATPLSPERIIDHYTSQVHRGRNNALFATCCWIRDCGGTIDHAAILTRVHANQPAIGTHRLESTEKRTAEALRTIQSAFSRPSGTRKKTRYHVVPNSLREHLLKLKQTSLLRVLEVVVKSGWRAGKWFTRNALLKVCKTYGVGDYSVRAALATLTPQQEPVFPASANAAIAAKDSGDISPSLNAIELRVSGSTQKRGRPSQQYQVPDLYDLCFAFGVRWSPGDMLEDTALASASGYRQALHIQLIKRRPGQYHRGWLANRLGVSKRTLNRYNRHLNLSIIPVYKQRFITWRTLGEMPSDLNDYRMGAFLEDEMGKRYPPLIPIARRLLRAKRQLVYKQRQANRYEVPIAMPQTDHAVAEGTCATSEPAFSLDAFPVFAASPAPVKNVPAAPAPITTAAPQQPRALTPEEQSHVDTLHTVTGGTLARHRAESLLREFGRFAIADVLHTFEQRGSSIKDPAAFIVSLLQSRYGNPQNGVSQSAVSIAESLYLTIEWHAPQHRMRWQKCCDLVTEYGETEISNLVVTMNRIQRGTIKNAAGYVVSQLQKSTAKTALSNSDTAEIVAANLTKITRELNPQNALAQSTSTELVRKYGTQAAKFALQVLQSRSNVTNPAGFIVSFLRSNAKR